MLPAREQRERIRQQYGWFYEYLVRLLAEDDPMYLTCFGAPPDEYEDEAAAIVLHLNEASSPAVLSEIIYEIFIKAFGPDIAPLSSPPSPTMKRRFEDLSNKIWTNWQRWNEQTGKE